MLAIESDPGLLAAFRGMPADPALQPARFNSEQMAESAVFPDNNVEWSVLQTMEGCAASAQPPRIPPRPPPSKPPSGDSSCPSSFSICSRATTIASASGASKPGATWMP
jgi:hypothetical protein